VFIRGSGIKKHVPPFDRRNMPNKKRKKKQKGKK